MQDLWLSLFTASLSAGQAPALAKLNADEALALVQARRGAEQAVEKLIAAGDSLEQRFSKLAVVQGDPGLRHYLRVFNEAVAYARAATSSSVPPEVRRPGG